MAKRLANVKTRNQVGMDYVISCLNIITPYGKKELKALSPFRHGEEKLLRQELLRVAALAGIYRSSKDFCDKVERAMMLMKDCTFTIERAKKNVLTVVELFELKSLLLAMRALKIAVETAAEEVRETFPKEFCLADTEDLLNTLDPRGDRINTFYIYDEFSERLGFLRKEKREIEIRIRSLKKSESAKLKEEKGIILTPKFDLTVSKSESPKIKAMETVGELVKIDEDYMSVTFALKDSEEISALIHRMNLLDTDIDDEEMAVRMELSAKVAFWEKTLLDNCRKVGKLDMTYAKAVHGVMHNLSIPEIIEEHKLEFENGRQLQVEDVLRRKERDYCPVSLNLNQGVTCITGANMGGKTVSLKLVGLIAILAQYGFFVPAENTKVGLSNFIQMLIGDSQSVERGLSSFGSEMEELKEILDNSEDRSLLLIDEIASGTNPKEGTALCKSLVEYLMKKPYISLITTHFDNVTDVPGVVNMQVAGLSGADFGKLKREIQYASRRERIELVGKYMDYRLIRVSGKSDVPKDALNIAGMLGVYSEIIDKAKEYL